MGKYHLTNLVNRLLILANTLLILNINKYKQLFNHIIFYSYIINNYIGIEINNYFLYQYIYIYLQIYCIYYTC